MKKMVLTVVAMMTLTLGFAKTNVHHPTRSAERYNISFNMRQLAAKLDLSSDQMEIAEVIQNCFTNDMQKAARARRFERKALVYQAVRMDVNRMQNILNDKQLRTFMLLLRDTLLDRGF